MSHIEHEERNGEMTGIIQELARKHRLRTEEKNIQQS